MDGKFLGKISAFRVGMGGYDDCMFGYWFTLTFDGGSCIGGGNGPWAIERTDRCKWTEADRSHQFDTVMRDLMRVVRQAKKRDVAELVGVPVEVTIEDGRLQSWRILEEVL